MRIRQDHLPDNYDYDFALVVRPGLLDLRIFEATGASIADIGEEHGHRVLRVCGKGTKVVLVPLPPAAGRAIDRATADRASGPILLNRRGARMDRMPPPAACVTSPSTRACGSPGRIPHAQAHFRHYQFGCRG